MNQQLLHKKQQVLHHIKSNSLVHRLLLDIQIQENGRIIIMLQHDTTSHSSHIKLEDEVKSALHPLFEKNENTKLSVVFVSDSSSGNDDHTKESNIKIKNKTKVPGVKKVVLIVSNKGGVGKSTTTVQLGLALQSLKYKVGLLDADIQGPSLSRMLAANQDPIIKNNLFIPPIVHKMKIMSAGLLIDKNQALVWRGPMVSKMLHRLLCGTEWRFSEIINWTNTDYLLIDTPPGTHDIHLSLLEKYEVDGAVLVSTPQQLSIDDVQKSVDMLNKFNIPILGVIENMSFLDLEDNKKLYIFGEGRVEKYADKRRLNFYGKIPIIPGTSYTFDQGKIDKQPQDILKLWQGIAIKIIDDLRS